MTTISINPQVLVGSLIAGVALAGLLIASITNLRGVRGPVERRFVAVCTVGLWLMLGLFLVGTALSEAPLRYAILAGYFIGAPILVYRVSVRRQLIRKWESTYRNSPEPMNDP